MAGYYVYRSDLGTTPLTTTTATTLHEHRTDPEHAVLVHGGGVRHGRQRLRAVHTARPGDHADSRHDAADGAGQRDRDGALEQPDHGELERVERSRQRGGWLLRLSRRPGDNAAHDDDQHDVHEYRTDSRARRTRIRWRRSTPSGNVSAPSTPPAQATTLASGPCLHVDGDLHRIGDRRHAGPLVLRPESVSANGAITSATDRPHTGPRAMKSLITSASPASVANVTTPNGAVALDAGTRVSVCGCGSRR